MNLSLHDYYILQLLILLSFKHFICDFVLQNSEIATSKAVYGSHGSIRHSMHHAFGTLLVCILFLSPKLSIVLAMFDFLIHYHIDWIKTKFGPKNYQDKHYWVWFGADQFLHQQTYVLILILALVSGETVDIKF